MKYRKEHRWYRFFDILLCRPLCWLLNAHVDNAEIRYLEGSFIAISNHPCFFDWVFVARALSPKSMAFVVNRLYFKGFLGLLLKKIGAVPRSLMTNDVASVRQMLRLARDGRNLCMFPDPCISLTGDTEGRLVPGTYRLLKRLGLTVVGLRHEGSFHTKTPWGRGLRRGRIDTRAFILFTPEELKTLSEAEGEARLKALIEGRVLEPRARNVAYKSRRRAEHLERLLFFCPHCGARKTLASAGERISCSACGLGARLNEYYELEWDGGEGPENLSAWQQLQRQDAARWLAEEGGALESDSIFHRFTDDSGYQKTGEGRLRLDGEGLHFFGESEERHYPIERIFPLFMKLSAGRVQLFEADECHEFEVLHPDQHLLLWRLAAEQLRAQALANPEE